MANTPSLSLTLLSAQGLKNVCTFGTMSPYAKAWVDPSMKRRTPVATNAGCTPVWSHKLSLPLPANAAEDINQRLYIQVMNHGAARDSIVGSATIPLRDLIRTTISNGLEFMAVQLQRPSGRVHGLVNFSIEIVDQFLIFGETSTSSKDLQNTCGTNRRSDVKFPTHLLDKEDSVENHCSNPPRLLSRKAPLAVPDEIGLDRNAISRPESVWKPLQIVEPVGKNTPIEYPFRRSSSNSSLDFSRLERLSLPSSKGTAHSVATDALDRSIPQTSCSVRGNACELVNPPHYTSRDDIGPAPASFAHNIFEGLLGAILIGDAITDTKGEHDDSGSDPSGLSNPHC